MPAVPPPIETVSFAYAPGDVIAGKYALEEQLGEGGMGAVFRARNTSIDMPVAIKVIRSDLDRAKLTGRLQQEARAAAQLSHPAIVRVFDVGQTALGDPFIVMELLRGESLAEALERDGRLTAVRAVQLLLPIADGLAAAHAKGFVHRDVKPDNVFLALDDEGQLRPKLVDFGIVKQLQPRDDSQLTQGGAVLGSPEYMSPEQARGLEHIDARSDVWALSIVMYEAISGATPFESHSYNALLRLIVEHTPPSLRELAVADEALSQIVMRGLAKAPEQRWQSMPDLGKALASWLIAQGITDDACGVSLQARLRQSDPGVPARAARASSPDSWPEPPSGVRAIDAWRRQRSTPSQGTLLANAPTVHAARRAATPVQEAVSAATPSRRWQVVVLVGFAALLLGGVLAWLLRRHAPDAAVIAPLESFELQHAQVKPEPSLPLEAPEPARATPLSATPPAPPTSAKLAVASAPPTRREPAPRAEPAPMPAPTSPAPADPKPGDDADLLAPY